jgi:hypothetical protein
MKEKNRMENEKPFALTKGSKAQYGDQLSMNNNTTKQNIFQFNLFTSEQPKKVLQTINCFCCERKRELDGYLFKLVPVCSDCRTENSLEILSNQIERRAKR